MVLLHALWLQLMVARAIGISEEPAGGSNSAAR
jgi:hypothetical protein